MASHMATLWGLHSWHSVLGLLLCLAAGFDDASVLLHASVRTEAAVRMPREAVLDTPEGPRAETPDGPILGSRGAGFFHFKNIPYAEPPKRFAAPVLKRRWGPSVLNATAYGPGCIGAATAGEEGESEDCLTFNAWVPTGGKRKMPVIVYFHGGMNQHGCGHEDLRQGDLITQSAKYPTIFINFDFRLGMLGWIEGNNPGDFTSNLGFRDQQTLLRWVRRNIHAFGGDPGRVALMGQSEGATVILAHMVSPASAGLFHRVLLHSPPADVWLRSTNRDRTKYMAQRLGCGSKADAELLDCLRAIDAKKLWKADWVSESLAGGAGLMDNLAKMTDFQNAMHYSQNEAFASQGWHLQVDGDLVPAEPRELLAAGRWNKVPVLITTTKNESVGVLPDTKMLMNSLLTMALEPLFKKSEYKKVRAKYIESLRWAGIPTESSANVSYQMLTDKFWTCNIRSMVKDIARNGGEVRLGVFGHSPKYDPIGKRRNLKCVQGAACHASDMMYLLPQGRGIGFRTGQDEEVAFSTRYSNDVLSFVHGEASPWVPFDLGSEPVTYYDMAGPRVMNMYRKEQCDVVDSSNGGLLPYFMKKR